jgi:hypothetical protein
MRTLMFKIAFDNIRLHLDTVKGIKCVNQSSKSDMANECRKIQRLVLLSFSNCLSSILHLLGIVDN